jgi:hypothetical protein
MPNHFRWRELLVKNRESTAKMAVAANQHESESEHDSRLAIPTMPVRRDKSHATPTAESGLR